MVASENPTILVRFFGKFLPKFTPLAEEFLHRFSPEDLQKRNFRYIFTVDGMTEISHLIENFVLANPRTADMHVSFQFFSRFEDQRETYEELAKAVNRMWLYGVPDVPPPVLPRTTIVDTSNTLLVKYWFVVAYGPGVHMTLLAEEISQGDENVSLHDRIYEGFYTFNPDFTYKSIEVLHLIFPDLVPAPLPPELL